MKYEEVIPALREIKSKCPGAYEAILSSIKSEYSLALKHSIESKDDFRFMHGYAMALRFLLLFWLDGKENETIPLT